LNLPLVFLVSACLDREVPRRNVKKGKEASQAGAPLILKSDMEPEPERDLAWSADGSGEGLHNEFLIQKILHVEEYIGRLMHLARNGEIHRRKATESPGGIEGSWTKLRRVTRTAARL